MHRALIATVALLVTTSCGTSQGDRSSAEVCAGVGLAAGSDENALCMRRVELQRQADLERIRQVRESARRGNNF